MRIHFGLKTFLNRPLKSKKECVLRNKNFQCCCLGESLQEQPIQQAATWSASALIPVSHIPFCRKALHVTCGQRAR